MPKLQDYVCVCENRFEHLHMNDDDHAACPSCGSSDVTLLPGGHAMGVIIPMYKGSLRQKAGYVHTHGDRPAEKGSVAVPRKGDF